MRSARAEAGKELVYGITDPRQLIPARPPGEFPPNRAEVLVLPFAVGTPRDVGGLLFSRAVHHALDSTLWAGQVRWLEPQAASRRRPAKAVLLRPFLLAGVASAARAAHCRTALAGDVSEEGRARAWIANAQGEQLGTWESDLKPLGQALRAAVNLAEEVVTVAGITLTQDQARDLRAFSETSLAAFAHYSEARAREAAGYSREDVAQALEGALAEDGHFGLARQMLAAVWEVPPGWPDHRAEEILSQWEQACPSDWRVWRARALHFAASGAKEQMPQVFEALSRAEALAPHRPEPHLDRLAAALSWENWTVAKDAAADALAKSQGDAYVCAWVGDLFCAAGRPDYALEYHRLACDKRPGDALYMCRLSVDYQLLHNPDEAFAWAKRAVETEPDAAEARWQLGHLLRLRGELALALCEFQEILKLEPGSVGASLRIALCQQASGQTRAAEKGLLAVARSKTDPETVSEAWRHLAQLYDETGRRKKALRAARAVLEVNPLESRIGPLLDRLEAGKPPPARPSG